jgi:hypothetical protein
MLPAFRQEISRQAVLLGDTEISTAHLVLALGHMDVQLAAAGRSVPDAVAERNNAGAVLARHGFRYDQAIGRAAAAAAEEPFDPVPDAAVVGVWPSLRTGDPRWGRRVLELLTAARIDAADRAHRAAGTTHLLAAALADGHSAAARLLQALRIDVDEVRSDLYRSLDGKAE